MKNPILLLYLLPVLLLSVVSCKMSSVSVNVLKPAEITIPSAINTLAVVNRSLPGEGNHLNNAIEGILSGEGLFVDRQASERTVSGVGDALLNSPRFKVTIPTGIDIRGTGTSRFPEPLEWAKVEDICKKFSADALITLETFDSNVGRKMEQKERTRKQDGETISYIEYKAHMDIGIEAGWRIYYPKEKRIVDQNVFVDHMYWDGVGKSEEEAWSRLPKPRYAIKDAGYFAGKQYGIRISPMWVWVSRQYYVKANEDFKNAKMFVKSNQWEEAEKLWTKHKDSPDMKIRGYAAYNLALAAEIKGDLDLALTLAKKAYSEFKIKKALSYSKVIQQRIYDQQRLEEQMERQ